MLRLARPLVLLAAGTVTVTAVLTGCTNSATVTNTAPSPAAPSSIMGSPTASTSPTASPADTPSAAPSSSADVDPKAVTIDITIQNRQVSPNGKKITVAKGQTVVLNVTSDADDEVHAHNAGDGYELEVKAGVPATGTFVATDAGSFEVESHHLEKVIAILVVR